MSAPGWIKIHRALLDHWCATEPEELSVWVRLLCEANFENRKSMINGCLIEVERGQLVFGLDAFSKKSGVSVSKLRRIISLLESDGMISRQKTSKYSLISIACYDKYQEDDRQNAGKTQANHNQIAAPKEVKNLRSEEDKKDKKDYALMYSELETKYNDLSAKYESLVAFKQNVEKQQKEELIGGFYMLSDEDKKDVVAHIDEYSLDDIEAKLSVICVRKKVNFDLDDTSKNENKTEEENPVTTFNLENAGDSVPAWIKAIQNHK